MRTDQRRQSEIVDPDTQRVRGKIPQRKTSLGYEELHELDQDSERNQTDNVPSILCRGMRQLGQKSNAHKTECVQ